MTVSDGMEETRPREVRVLWHHVPLLEGKDALDLGPVPGTHWLRRYWIPSLQLHVELNESHVGPRG